MNDLQKALDEYLTIRRTLGFKLSDEGRVLPQFVNFLKDNGASFITADLALQWATQPKNVLASHWARRLSMVRVFSMFRSASDPRTQIPPKGLLPFRYHRKPPYVYSDNEISGLLEAASRLGSANNLRAATYATVIGLIAATGMRIREPISLDREDVDLARGILAIRRTKFGKSRLIPVHSSTTEKLAKYNELRSRIFPRPNDASFFVSQRGIRLSHWSVRGTFVKLSHEIALRGPNDSHGPRLHDLRHTFAVKTLIKWYRSGVDVERRLPELAAYLGHKHVNDTYWYITAVPELLRLATMRSDTIRGGLS
jgi:integrase